MVSKQFMLEIDRSRRPQRGIVVQIRGAGGNLFDNPLDTWGGVKDIFDYWARRFQTRPAQLSQGE